MQSILLLQHLREKKKPMNKDSVVKKYDSWDRYGTKGTYFFPYVFDFVIKWYHEDSKGKDNEPMWNDDTTLIYKDYINHIMEWCPIFQEKPISEITEEEFDIIAKELRTRRQGNGEFYSTSTYMKWIYLIRITLIEAEKLDICGDKLYGTFYETPVSIEKIRTKSLKKYKSLTPVQEIKAQMILEKKMDEVLERGECVPGKLIGLYIDLDTGARPGELCGIRYGREYENEIDPNVHELELIETNVLDCRYTKPGGKTSNAPRKMPINNKTHVYIARCRKAVKNNILKNWDKYIVDHPDLGEKGKENLDSYIDDKMPVVCSGTNIFKNSTPKELAEAARELFKKIGFEGYYLYLIKTEMDEDDPIAISYYIGYKDPTCYVLRRNFATQMSIVCTDIEIEYLMGHEIVDDLETRNKLSSPEHVLAMARRMKNRPLYAYKEDRLPVEVIKPIEMEQISGEQEYIFTVEPNATAVLQIATKEPIEELEITIETDAERSVMVNEKIFQQNKQGLFVPVNERPVDILDKLYAEYRKAELKVIKELSKETDSFDDTTAQENEDMGITEAENVLSDVNDKSDNVS